MHGPSEAHPEMISLQHSNSSHIIPSWWGYGGLTFFTQMQAISTLVFHTTPTNATSVWRSPNPSSCVSACFSPSQTYIAVWRLSLPNPASLPFMFHRLYHQEFFFFFNVPIFSCAGSLLLCMGLSSWGKQTVLSSCCVQASHCGGFSYWGEDSIAGV